MSKPSFMTPASVPFPSLAWLRTEGKSFLAPYYITVAAVLGAITAGFAVVFVLLIIVTANFNVLGWME
jgi:hypothetical protein